MHLLILLSGILSLALHDYHVCISNIYIQKENKKVEINHILFVDDLEKALMLDGTAHRFGDEMNTDENRTLIENYLEQHFSIEEGDSKVKLTLLGLEWEDYHSINVFQEGSLEHSEGKLEVFNSIFLEVSGDQQNMHHFQIGEKKKSLLLREDKTTGSINY